VIIVKPCCPIITEICHKDTKGTKKKLGMSAVGP
jgi:hypothetical protein